MSAFHGVGRSEPISVARAVLQKADGTIQVHYSIPELPWHHFRRRLKLWRHLQMMRAEDKEMLS